MEILSILEVLAKTNFLKIAKYPTLVITCFTFQESAQGQQASQEALRAKRNQEATEREWRRKEREEQLRREENEARMKAAREKQIKQKEHFQAVQADRERQVFNRILQSQIEEARKEKEQGLALSDFLKTRNNLKNVKNSDGTYRV